MLGAALTAGVVGPAGWAAASTKASVRAASVGVPAVVARNQNGNQNGNQGQGGGSPKAATKARAAARRAEAARADKAADTAVAPAPTTLPAVPPPVPAPATVSDSRLLLATAAPAVVVPVATAPLPAASLPVVASGGPRPAPGWHRSMDPTALVTGAWPGLSIGAARGLDIPIGFGLLVAVFLLVQGRLDRRDPKVLRAPATRVEETVGFQ